MTQMTFTAPARPVRLQPPSLRLTRRGRLVLTVLLLLLALTALTLGGVASQAATERPAPRSTVVQPGDTLWDVAVRVAPGTDPRKTVLRLRQLNDLPDGRVAAGRRLLLPAR